MSWAKYAEDNLEIMQDRMFLRQTCKIETEIKVVCKAPIPVIPQIVIKFNQEPIAEENKYEDIYIICKDCGRKFLFSASAQKHYDRKGWDQPKRCKCCRDFRNTRFLKDIHKAIEETTIMLLAMTKEERIEWFCKSRYPHSLNFDMEIGNTVYAVTTHFNETANESLQEKTQRIILNKM